jgi:hypothetical protein
MRIVSSLLLLISLSIGADAQAPKIDRIEVTEYGIYTADEQSCERNAQGVLTCERTNMRHAVTTLTIPAQHGIHFGFRFKIVGTPDAAPVEVTGITNFPPPGLKSPSQSAPLRNYQYTKTVKIGEIGYTDYAFDDPWELVPGPWTVEIWVDHRRLAIENFTVVRP